MIGSDIKRDPNDSSHHLSKRKQGTFGVILGGALNTAETVQKIAGLSHVPPVRTGTDEDGKPIRLCSIDARSKTKIQQCFAETRCRTKVVFVP